MAESPRIKEATKHYIPRATQRSTVKLDEANRDVGTCEKCGRDYGIGDWPFCPHGRGVNEALSDSIPGGVVIEHGLCNLDGTPRTYYSHSEIKKEAERRGFTNVVTHQPSSGSDKNKRGHTSRWV